MREGAPHLNNFSPVLVEKGREGTTPDSKTTVALLMVLLKGKCIGAMPLCRECEAAPHINNLFLFLGKDLSDRDQLFRSVPVT